MKVLFHLFPVFLSLSIFSYWGTEYYDWTTHIPSFSHEQHIPRQKHGKNSGNIILYGPQSLHNNTIQGTLTVHGPLEFENLAVTKSILVNGPLNGSNEDATKPLAKKITIHGPASLNAIETYELSVMGPLTLSNATVTEIDVKGPLHLDTVNSETVTVYGPCSIKDSSIKSLVIILDSNSFWSSDTFEFHHVKIDSITVKTVQKNLMLEIFNESNIKNITFKKKQGKVIVDTTSTIGTVNNGTKELFTEDFELQEEKCDDCKTPSQSPQHAPQDITHDEEHVLAE